MISEHLPVFIVRSQNAVFIGCLIVEFPDAETEIEASGEKGRMLC
jgi:hypothetical protein